MTEQRKTLLAIVAMLLVANAVALAVINHKPQKVWWFGMATELPPTRDGAADPQERLAVISADGLTLAGRRVSYGAMIDNIGRRRFREIQADCFEGDCEAGPWTISAFASAETPLSTVFEAVQRAQSLCRVQAVVFADFPLDETIVEGFGYPLLLAHSSDPGVDAISAYGVSAPDQLLQRGETLDQFGERTGCARVSPLRP